MKQCLICKSTIEKGDFCDAHIIAKKNVEEQFKNWQNAFGKLTWKEYLKRLTTDEEVPVGDWAKEVAEYFLKKEK